MNSTQTGELAGSKTDTMLMWITIASGVLIFFVILMFACKYCSKIRKGEFNYDKEAAYLGRVAEARLDKRYSIREDYEAAARACVSAGGGNFAIPLVTVTDYDADGGRHVGRPQTAKVARIDEHQKMPNSIAVRSNVRTELPPSADEKLLVDVELDDSNPEQSLSSGGGQSIDDCNEGSVANHVI